METTPSPVVVSADAPTLKNRGPLQTAWVVGICIVAVFAFMYIDVTLRARSAYQEAEKYIDWNAHPEKKQAYFEAWFERQKAEAETRRQKGKLSAEEYAQAVEALTFDKNFNIEESSLKYAYQWYKDTYELFSPPESKWVKMARQKAPETLALWKEELRRKNIPFEDYMFE